MHPTIPITTPSSIAPGQATWADYLTTRDRCTEAERSRVFFDGQRLWVEEMSGEGIEHAGFCDLFTMMLFVWFSQQAGQPFASLGRCLIEQPSLQAAAPDLVLYVGEDYPRWQPGDKRRIELDQMRVPDLVGEIADTTLASDLDQKKQLYAAMAIPEYWVIDVQARQIFMFLLQDNQSYQPVEQSQVLKGLPKSLIEQALTRTALESNGAVAMWFAQQIQGDRVMEK
ncbi:MAG: Uma2 family endonuclease [Synechococcales bacterium]|nr:Uma2 family endonuclease [Synechococcales bacterium]